jgi:hypothetical protein
MTRRACWRNAQKTALGWTAAPALAYAEGWVLLTHNGADPCWIPHAWNVDRNGNAVDRTLPNPDTPDVVPARYIGRIIPAEDVRAAFGRNDYIWGQISDIGPPPPGPPGTG